ncbi:MAG: CbiX/SirB N-terminal domain-containing protein [Rubrivivax sp.]|nr:CbiX/SirB N-terminal domain-containing protein [Rubrivivax sp.]
MTIGLILFAHGARDPRWAEPFEAVAAQVLATRPGVAVRLAFLEFMTPTLAEAAAELAAMGCATVQVLPMFLGAGGHVRKDLPRLLGDVQAAHPQMQVTLTTAVGELPSVVSAMAAAAVALLEPQR